ncbi:Kalirin [Aphelenchoides bicaudatus]|nr:Kalirin [Aphelenchoides bicaudatus]
MIQQKHIAEKNRWPAQREILKHAAYVSGFLKECAGIHSQIEGWNGELQTLPEKLFQQHNHMPNIAQYHKKNMANVEEAVNDALRRTEKIIDSISNMNLVMHNNEPAIDAVMKMGNKLRKLEDNVMKVARRISEHFQWKKIVDRIGQEADDLTKKVNILTEELRMMPCLAFNASEVDEQNLNHMELRDKISVMKEIVLTFELNVKHREQEIIAIDLIQQLKERLEIVKMNFAHLIHLFESRIKLINFASQYYKCLASAIPAIESIEKTYNHDTSEQCVSEQKEELSRRLDLIRNEIQSYKAQRVKFVNALNYAQRCADQFNNRLRRFEDNQIHRPNRLTQERCQMLQTQVNACIEEIGSRQTHLLQLWAKRNEKMLACEESCLLEILAKQITDYFETKTAELQQKFPQKQIATLSKLPSSEVESLMEFVLGFERSYKSELKKINQLNVRMKDFYEHIRTSYHFEFVEQAVKRVEEQSKRFEELLRNYHQKCTTALGKTNAEIMSQNASVNRQSDGSLEERISQQSRESNEFTIKDEAARKLKEPMKELLATERDYINNLQKCIDVYLRAYRMSEQSAPQALRCKERELFGNVEDLYQFHSNQFIEALNTYEQTPELVYCCFGTYFERLKDLYVEYLLNRAENSSLIDPPDVTQYFNAIQQRYNLEQHHSLQSMLIKPFQRITHYKLILEKLMEHSTESRKDIKLALDKIFSILREANDRDHLNKLEAADELRIGDFVMTETFVVSEPKRYFGRDKERQVFLFESNIVFAKKEELPSKKFRYLCKYRYLLSDIHIVEHVEGGDQTKFGLRKGNLTQSDNTTILKASSEESRRQWLIKIRELILEMPIKVQAESSENGSMLSYYNGSLESVKKLSIQESNRVSTSSSESNAIKQTSSNGTDPSTQVEMRRPRNLLQNQSFAPLQNGITLSNDNFLLPLDENHYENLMPELSTETPTSSIANHKRSTVSSTASSDIDLPPAMQQLPEISVVETKVDK